MPAAAYAARLLADLDATPVRALRAGHDHPAIRWAQSGAMHLTGQADALPLMVCAPLATCADGALAACEAMALQPFAGELRGAELLGERAAIAGLSRQGAIAAGGACRILDCADGSIALNLARDSDWDLLPAWLETDRAGDWASLSKVLRERAVPTLVERGRLLGLALADVNGAWDDPVPWFRRIERAARRGGAPRDRPRVIDLSSLWAGPLCTQLLQLGGAEVIKVESAQRPDGARHGSPAFFDLLNAGKRSVSIDLRAAHGPAQLLRLLRGADIVIEASRPRALRQLGIDAASLVHECPGLSWISIVGYGRDAERGQWIAYGDDAGVAAGLTAQLEQACGERVFVGDAIADPLCGLHAALLAWASWRRGGGCLIGLSLAEVLRCCLLTDQPASHHALRERHRQWTDLLTARGIVASPPRARPVRASASSLGADNGALLGPQVARC